MFILKFAGKILLLPVWLILFVIGLAVKMTVQTYAVVRGILEMMQEWSGASKLILAMDTWFERLMADQ